ncbi:RadC family protein [Hydrogenophaga sp.]|uniref:RadC family protein n=1 Tax=Hydrogenophaga sp. TaxID=1904254 RepID=UPI00286DFAA2|nr:DNA repair protein RadC [Hydrogenophaga sp.]
MQHDLFSSLDSFLSVPAGSGGLLIRDVTGQYRPAEADEVLLAAQRLLAAQVRGSDLMDSPAVVKEFLRSRLGHLPHEVFAVMHLNSQNRVLDYVEMFRGTVSQTSVYPREVVRDALLRNSSALVLVHNHPSGEARPSRADEHLTQTIKQATALVDVRVLDHFIVAGEVVCSMAEIGLV